MGKLTKFKLYQRYKHKIFKEKSVQYVENSAFQKFGVFKDKYKLYDMCNKKGGIIMR